MPKATDLAKDKCFYTALDKLRPNIPWPGGKPQIPLGTNGQKIAGLVGTAYGYWLAHALLRQGQKRGEKIEGSLGIDRLLAYEELVAIDPETGKLHRLTGEKLLTKLMLHSKHLMDAPYRAQWISQEQIESLLFFAELEHGYRASIYWNPISLFIPPPEAHEELKKLMAVTELERFRDPIIVNPLFGHTGNKDTIYADGDVITGTTLVEVKSGIQHRWQITIRQLLIYWALNQLNDDPFEIKNIAAYYPRYKLWYQESISALLNSKQQSELIALVKSITDDRGPPKHKKRNPRKKSIKKRSYR